jgi:hypothetical protein
LPGQALGTKVKISKKWVFVYEKTLYVTHAVYKRQS